MDISKILSDFALNPLTWGIVLGIVWLAWLSKTKKAALIRDAAAHAYEIVEGMQQNGTLPAGLTKEYAALKQFVAILQAQNYRVTDAAIELAKLLWASFAARDNKVTASTATLAASVAAASRPP